MKNNDGLWGMKTLCVVTGASQGIGKTLAIEFSKQIAPGSTVVLISRNLQALADTRDLIQAEVNDITVLIESQDFSEPKFEMYQNIMDKCTNGKSYESYMLVHNAGTEGPSTLTADMSSLTDWEVYMKLNLFSMSLLTSAFLAVVPKDAEIHRTIINITSLCAVQAFSGLGFYCVGKASREMYLKVLAAENPHIKVLSYSPGPVDTNMITRVIDNSQWDETKEMFVGMKKNSTLLSPLQTITKLVGILKLNTFDSGCRIDYFDR